MSEGSMEQSLNSSHLAGGNLHYLDELYEAYLSDPTAYPMNGGNISIRFLALRVRLRETFHIQRFKNSLLLGKDRNRSTSAGTGSVSSDFDRKQVQVQRLINAYRIRGHQRAALDPLGIMERERVPDLELGFHDLSAADLDTVFQIGMQNFGMPKESSRTSLTCSKPPTAVRLAPNICTLLILKSGCGCKIALKG